MKDQNLQPRPHQEMAERVRSHDWSQTPLGPCTAWSAGLQTAAAMVLAAPVPMLLLWGLERVQLYNDACREFMEGSGPAGLGQPVRDSRSDLSKLAASLVEWMPRGEALTLAGQRLLVERPGGPIERYATISFSSLPDGSGDAAGVLVTILERPATAAGAPAIRPDGAEPDNRDERTAMLEEVFRRSPSFLHVLRGPEFIFEFANEAYYRLVGHRDLLGRPAFEALPEAADGGYQERIARVMATGEPFSGRELPVTLARTPGSPPEERIIDLVYLPLIEPDGTCVRVLGHGTDVTEHVRARDRAETALRASEVRETESVLRESEARQAEAALREAVARYELQVRLFDGVASTTPDFVYLFDREGCFRYANRRLLEVWGMALPDVIGKTCLELGYEPWHHEMHMREIAQVVGTKQPIKGEVPFKAPLTGVFGVYEYIFTPVVGPDGEVELIAGTTRDITERKQAADALLELARRKDEFLATLAHELRNPLAPIATGAELLRLRADDPAAVLRVHETIRRQVDHMRRLVDDLLDVARITRGMVELRTETVDLGALLSSAVQMARPLIDGNGQELAVSVPLEPVRLTGDPHRLIQVVTNLLTNAAKFTPSGGRITVAGGLEGTHAVIRVQDTGKGIPAEMLPHIFDLFTQVNPSIDRAEGGLGLGLSLVQRLVEMHGGRVEAQSAGVGRGSEFTVRLPAHPAVPASAVPQAAGPSADGRRKLRVLVVDDNVDAVDTLAELLRLWGHEVAVAYTGSDAVTMARKRQAEVLLLDIGLPGMDGYQVAQQIRQDPELAAIRLVAVTGFGQEDDRQRAHEAGFDAHLTKPVAAEGLREVLEAIPRR